MTDRFLAWTMALTLGLTGCGTHDYESVPEPQRPGVASPAVPGEPPPPAAESPLKSRLAPKVTVTDGYLWRGLRWIEVSDEEVQNLKCIVADGNEVNYFQVIGTTLVAGAVLGLVIRASGSWFFGQPVEPGPRHWFWNRIDRAFHTTGQGISRGAGLAGFCALMLSGASLWPIEGILGRNFSAISSAVAVGSVSAIAAAKPISDWLESQFQKLPTRVNRNKGTFHNGAVMLNRWSNRSDIGQGIRYQIVPGVFVIGIGFGVGLLIYDHLQKGDPVNCPPRQVSTSNERGS